MGPEEQGPASPAEHLAAYRWAKGTSGNPGGRPKGRSVSAMLRELLEKDHHGKKIGELLAERLLKDALSGKLGHIKEILDRAEGRVADRMEVGGSEGQGLVINVVRVTAGKKAERAEDERNGES